MTTFFRSEDQVVSLGPRHRMAADVDFVDEDIKVTHPARTANFA